jgi:hypothetical protein
MSGNGEGPTRVTLTLSMSLSKWICNCASGMATLDFGKSKNDRKSGKTASFSGVTVY